MSYWRSTDAESDIVGQTIKNIIVNKEDNELLFRMADGSEYKMYHDQDCCESVTIDWPECSDLNELIGKKIVGFKETSDNESSGYRGDDSSTVTKYRFETDSGIYNIVWFGCSNGYYSESPSFYKTKGIE